MRTILFLLFLIFQYSISFSQDIMGDWKGNLDVNGAKIPLIFNFFKDSSGAVSGKWESPLQKATGLFSNINASEDSLNVTIKNIGGTYNGRIINNDSVTGVWHQNGVSLPLNFKKGSGDEIVSKSVSTKEKKEIPYANEKEISVTSSTGNPIFGTLLSRNKDQKLAIIIAGSGPTDREGNNPLGVNAYSYQMLARALDSQNIATFRYDKSGIGKSITPGLKENEIIFENSIKDVEKIFDYLHDSLGFKDIYLIGHSEGSLIGMVAAQRKNVKGFISIAGMGRPFDIIIEEQAQAQQWPDSLRSRTRFIFWELKNGKQVDDVPQELVALFRPSVQPYLISLLKYSPQKEIEKVKCPILILQGTCDIQVKETDAENLHNANKKSKLVIIRLMTHTLKNAGKNCEDQQQTYTDASLPLNKVLVKEITGFIKK